MKKLQKGFSLVELLVVVAIIGVLAGVGIVGYSGYTQSAKERVAVANFKSVKRFIETELTLLNNNVQTTSASVRTFLGAADTCALTTAAPPATSGFINTAAADVPLRNFIRGVVCYFDVAGYGSSFGNPFDPLISQVVYMGGTAAGGLGAPIDEGTINIDLVAVAATRAGATVGPNMIGANSNEATRGGFFIVEYFQDDPNNPGTPIVGDAGEIVGQIFELED